MNGKLVGSVILLLGIFVGGTIYYLQIYGFYREVPAARAQELQLISLADGTAQSLAATDFRAIDADSSPIRYRACFTTTLSRDAAQALYVGVPGAEPRIAPAWFDCFDAEAISADLRAGTMSVFLGVKNIAYGVDRVIAIGRNGRGYSWHVLNECGTKAYDGTVVGEECPARPGAATSD